MFTPIQYVIRKLFPHNSLSRGDLHGMSKRQSPRVNCKIKSTLEYHGHMYAGCVENISGNGLLMRLDETVLARPGDSCRLSLYLSEEKAPVKLKAEMVHVGFSMAGVRFLPMDEQGKNRLATLLAQVQPLRDDTARNIDAGQVSPPL